MDARITKYLAQWLPIFGLIVGGALYLERRMSALEARHALQADHAAILQGRVDRIELDTSLRLAVDRNGGFRNDAVRSALNATIRIQARELHLVDAEQLARDRAEIERRIQALVERNSLRP